MFKNNGHIHVYSPGHRFCNVLYDEMYFYDRDNKYLPQGLLNTWVKITQTLKRHFM